MKMMRVVFSILCVAAAGAAVAQTHPATPPSAGGMSVPGGWNAGRKDDPAVKAAAGFAAGQLPGAPKVKSIDEVNQQVVAGMNYRLELTLSDASRWEVTVYRRFNGEMQMTNSMKLWPVDETTLSLNDHGMALIKSGKTLRQIAFGAKRADVMKALSFRSEPGESHNDDCGAGPTDFASWPDGLNLLFQGGEFGGWSLDERADTLKVNKTVAIGMTREQLQKVGKLEVSQTSLGVEFTIGEVSGVLSNASPRGKVTALWAGLSCVFR